MTKYIDFLKNTQIFKNLPDSEIQKLRAACLEKHFESGEIIFKEGGQGRYFFIVIKGIVEIWKDYNSVSRDLLAVYEHGQCFGELALLDDFPRSATAVVRDAAQVLVIERNAFQSILKNSEILPLTILQSLTQMIRERTDTYISSLREKHRKLEVAYERLKREIGERRQVQKRLDDEASTDQLTALPNRAVFLNQLQIVMGKARRDRRYNYAVFYLDVDRFCLVNESLGHMAGDEVLTNMAERLTRCLGERGIAARFSGDEFAVLVPDSHHPRDVLDLVQRIQKSLEFPFEINNRKLFVTASIGVVMGRASYRSSVDILRDADIAMFGAKTQGHGKYQVYDQTLHKRTADTLQLEADLRGAIDRKEFFLEYQPIVSLEKTTITGFETLVRWIHPERGIIPPDIFIPIAEKTGAIIKLGDWVLMESCCQMKAWTDKSPTEHPLFVNVNISSKQFMQKDFMAKFKETLQKSRLPGRFLKLEITESILIENVERLSVMLNQIKRLGVQIAIDDFGTGYSSLSYLNKFPIDVLKIDRSFITQMIPHRHKDLVPIIISIAHSLDMEVVAEGIETIAQFQNLQALGCEYGQGFLFSKPLKMCEAELLMSAEGGSHLCVWPERRIA